MRARSYKFVIAAWLALFLLSLVHGLTHIRLSRLIATDMDPYGLLALADVLSLVIPVALFAYFLRSVEKTRRIDRERELLSTALQSFTEAAVIVDGQQRIRYINAAACVLSGWSAAAALDRPAEEVLQIVVTDRPVVLADTLADVLRGHNPVSLEAETALIDREGNRHPIEVSMADLTGAAAVLITLRDISEWTAFQDDLALAHAAIEKSGTPFYKVSPYGQILDINDSACRLFGYHHEELAGNHISTLDPDKKPSTLDKYWDTLRTGGTLIVETQLHHSDGRPIDVEITSNYIVFNGKEMDFSFIKDISLLKERERNNRFLSQIYSILFHTNQALLKCRTEAELFARICQIVIADGGMAMAWVGVVDNETGDIHIRASHGGNLEYLTGLQISARPDVQAGQGPSGIAFRECRPIIIHDFLNDPRTAAWRDRAGRYGWQSSASIGIQRAGKSYAVFSFYHYENHAFTDPIVELLAEMARNIGHALDRFDLEGQRSQTESQLRIAAKVFESNEAMFVLDTQRDIARINQAFTHATGFQASELIGRPAPFLSALDRDNPLSAAVWAEVDQEGSWQGEIQGARKQGGTYTTWLHLSGVKDAAGAVTHYVGSFIDLAEYKTAEAHIRQLAYFDQVTELPNRRMLLERMEQVLQDPHNPRRRGALLHLDLDRFKNLNDTQGHEYGDLLLQHCARRIRASVGHEATVARIGGDEFAVLIDTAGGDDRAHVEQLAETLLNALGQPYHLRGDAYTGSVSIGAALYTTAADTAALLQRADLAVHEAKRAGGNTVRFFDPMMQEDLERRAQLEADLRYACEGGQMQLHFQPEVDRDGRVIAAEALLRWRHPRLGWIAPGDFIPIAEDTGAIVPIGRWVLQECCRQLKAWEGSAATRALSLSMNVSAREFQSNGFIESVRALLRQTGVNPRRLVLELTESMLMQDLEASILKMNALKDLGLAIALDDFGTGYSSLAHLKRLPVDQLKIDRTFVKDLGASQEDDAIVKAIIQMGITLGKAIIAEGVENAMQRELLIRYGCHSFQGFLFGRPLPKGGFEQALQIAEERTEQSA